MTFQVHKMANYVPSKSLARYRFSSMTFLTGSGSAIKVLFAHVSLSWCRDLFEKRCYIYIIVKYLSVSRPTLNS